MIVKGDILDTYLSDREALEREALIRERETLTARVNIRVVNSKMLLQAIHERIVQGQAPACFRASCYTECV